MSLKIEKNLVSIIIPSYYREHTNLLTIKSVINQIYFNIEIIFVDGCPKGIVVPIIQLIIEKEPRLQLLINSDIKGLKYTRNQGIKNAKGRYIFF